MECVVVLYGQNADIGPATITVLETPARRRLCPGTRLLFERTSEYVEHRAASDTPENVHFFLLVTDQPGRPAVQLPGETWSMSVAALEDVPAQECAATRVATLVVNSLLTVDRVEIVVGTDWELLRADGAGTCLLD